MHRESESLEEASEKKPKEQSSSKHNKPGTSESTNFAAAAVTKTNSNQKNASLFEKLVYALENNSDIPLYQVADPRVWLQDAWSEPVLPFTLVWTMVLDGTISHLDLVALILSIWGDKSIQSPPRYLNWLVQRWQASPDSSPVSDWDDWRDLARLPLIEWFSTGQEKWLNLASSGIWSLPLGLETLRIAVEKTNLPEPMAVTALPLPTSPDLTDNGLNTRIGNGRVTIRDIWRAVLGQLSLQLNRSTYTNWVEGAHPVSFEDGVLTIKARHPLARKWLAERLNHSIEASVSKLAQMPIKVHYIDSSNK